MTPSGTRNDQEPVAIKTDWFDPMNETLRAIAYRLNRSIFNRGLLLGLALVAVNALIVSHFQPPTALALLRNTPPLTLLTSTMLNLGPIAAQVWMVYSLITGGVAFAREDGTRGLSAVLTAAGIWITSMFLVDRDVALAGWPLALLVLAVLIGSYVAHTVNRKWAENGDLSVLALGTISVMLAVALWGSGQNLDDVKQRLERPYLPTEVLTLGGDEDGQSRTIVGYVLESSSQWASVLLEHERTVAIVRSAEIEERRVCALGIDEKAQPKDDYFTTARGNYERCP